MAVHDAEEKNVQRRKKLKNPTKGRPFYLFTLIVFKIGAYVSVLCYFFIKFLCCFYSRNCCLIWHAFMNANEI